MVAQVAIFFQCPADDSLQLGCMRYYLLNLPAQVRSQADYEHVSKVLAEIPRDIIAGRISHKEYRILDREISELLKDWNEFRKAGWNAGVGSW